MLTVGSYLFLVRGDPPPQGGVTGFLKVGDWFFGTPLPPGEGGLAKWVRRRRRRKFFLGFFHVFAYKMPWFWQKWLLADPPGGVSKWVSGFLKVSDWFFESGKWPTPRGVLKRAMVSAPLAKSIR